MSKVRKILKNVGGDWKKYRIGIILLLIYIITTQLIFGTMCPFAITTGLPCPGCGVTRAMLFILQGKFIEAFRMNLFAYPAIGVILYISIKRYVLEQRKIPVLVLGVLGFLMFAYWIWRMVTMYPGEAPMVYRTKNLMSFLFGGKK